MELKDYSGPYREGIRLEEFSKEALIKLIEVASKDFVGVDGHWYSRIREKYGADTAWELNRHTWAGKDSFFLLHAVPRLCRAFKIEGNDCMPFLKFLQLAPDFGGVGTKFTAEIKSNYHVIVTVYECSSLNYFERHGETDLAYAACNMDVHFLQGLVDYFNPKIRVKALGARPRKSKNEPACQWELTLAE